MSPTALVRESSRMRKKMPAVVGKSRWKVLFVASTATMLPFVIV
jgi:hypothetical protein